MIDRMDKIHTKMPSPGHPRPGRITSEEAALRDQRIIATAVKLFLEHGYADTTINLIAQEARVSKRTLYLTFGDKSKIFLEAMRTTVGRLSNIRLEIDERDRGDVVGVFERIARSIYGYVLSEQGIAMTRIVIAEAGRFPELVPIAQKQGAEHVHEIVGALFSEIEQKGVCSFSDHDEAVSCFTDFVIAPVMFHTLLGLHSEPPSDLLIRRRITQFLAACKIPHR